MFSDHVSKCTRVVLLALVFALGLCGCSGRQPQWSIGDSIPDVKVQDPLQNRSYFENQKLDAPKQRTDFRTDRLNTRPNDHGYTWHAPESFVVGIESRSDSDVSSSSNYISNNHYYTFTIHPPPMPQDEVVIKSLTIRNCVARGLIHNLSDSKFARSVEVTLKSKDSNYTASWTWPLTVMPGEYAPFEISIDWDPSYLDPVADGPPKGPGERLGSWHLSGNVLSSVTADFTYDVDMSRAFALNWDQSGPLERYGELQQLVVHDERLFALDEWDYWYQSARVYQLISDDAFEYSFPKHLTLSDEMNAIASRFVILELSDLYYIPDIVFPVVYDEDIHRSVDDIKVYQAITKGISVLDVRELVPFVVESEKKNTGFRFSRFIPDDNFVIASSQISSPRFVILTVPEIYPEINDGIYSAAVSYGSDSTIWVGQSNTPFHLNTVDILEEEKIEIGSIQDEVTGHQCNRAGGLTKEEVRYGSSPDVADITLGYHGLFREYGTSHEPIDSLEIDLATVSAQDGFIRGLVLNLSDSLFARDVTVQVAQTTDSEITGTWHWPLTLQPEERAPFEIYLGGWNGSIPISELEFQVNGKFSQQVDISRSFQARGYNHGTVYDDESTARAEAVLQSTNSNLNITADAAFHWPHQHLSLSEYVNRYNVAFCSDQLESESRETRYSVMCETRHEKEVAFPLHFVDLHVQLEIPDSHPSLGSQIVSQSMDSLRSYAASFDEDGKVNDVRELVPFTNFNSEEIVQGSFSTVNGIPSRSLLSRNSFRLLFTLPYSEVGRPDLRNLYQVWIGSE